MATIAESLAHARLFERAGRLDEAEHVYRLVLTAQPDHVDALYGLGKVCYGLNKHSEALPIIERLLVLAPLHAGAHNCLGALWQAKGDVDAAERCYRRAVELNPQLVGAHTNLGIIFESQGNAEAAGESFRRAVDLLPNHVEGRNNLGAFLERRGDFEAAAGCYRRAIELHPRFAEGYGNLGALMCKLARFDDAAANYVRAVEIKPDYAEAHLNHALLLLMLGDFERGFAEYEWRHKTRYPALFHPQPLWTGEELHGKRIVLHAEQGLGDTLHLLRYRPLVEARGGRAVWEVQKPLIPLLRQSGFDPVIERGAESLPDCELQLPLHSLPHVFRTTVETIPAQVPYLLADPQRVDSWRERLAGYPGFRVGICWRGSKFATAGGRSATLADFAPLARVPGVRLFSLQKNEVADEPRSPSEHFELVDFGDELDTDAPFLDSAAIMKNLDIVVSVDTAAAHLAGAMGVPVWVPLLHVADWRWLRERSDSPWYPSMRLFRQQQRGVWADVFQSIRDALADLAAPR